MANEITWSKVKLGDIARLKNGYSFKSETYDKDKDGKYTIITIKNVTGRRFVDTADCNTVSELPDNIRDHQILKSGDILISMTGNVGRVSMSTGENQLLNQRVGLIELTGDVDRDFIYQLLSSREFEDAMISKGHGAAQPNIGKDDIENHELYIPDSLDEQKRIANLLSKFDELIQINEFKANNLIKAKTQLMNDIFSGGFTGST